MARSTDRPPRGSPRRPEPPFLPPAPRPQLPPADPSLQQRGLAALALAILSLLAVLLIDNKQRGAVVAAVAVVVAVIALVLAVSAMSAAKRAGARRPRGALAGVWLGVAGLLFSGLTLVYLIFSTQFDQYTACMHAATTSAGQQACKTQLEHSITNRLGGN